MDWSTKWHRLRWGWYISKQGPATHWYARNYDECDDIFPTDGTKHMFKFGNEWALQDPYKRPFQHPRLLTHDNWHFVDNPEIPHLLWPSHANPKGKKSWVRCVRGGLFTHTHGSGTDRVNRLLRRESSNRVTHWRDLVDVDKPRQLKNKHVLITPVTAPNYEHYYDTTQREWLKEVIKDLTTMGFTYDIRQKPSREGRIGNQLVEVLSTGRYCATVSQHSVAAVETLLAGIPAVTTGPNSCLGLDTPMHQFMQGELKQAHETDVEQLVDSLLHNCLHKSELAEGLWTE